MPNTFSQPCFHYVVLHESNRLFTVAPNAYFAFAFRFFKNKRIVLYDTLIKQVSRDVSPYCRYRTHWCNNLADPPSSPAVILFFREAEWRAVAEGGCLTTCGRPLPAVFCLQQDFRVPSATLAGEAPLACSARHVSIEERQHSQPVSCF